MHASMQSQLKNLSVEKKETMSELENGYFLMSLFVSNPSENFMAFLLSTVL